MRRNSDENLKKEIGTAGLALNAINLTVGAGIFVLPAIVAINLGASGFIAYLLCGLLVVLIMLCYADVGSKTTRSGGSYAYVEEAFGPLPGFIINTMFWFAFSSLADAAVVNAMADILAKWYPVLLHNYARIPFFIVVFGLLCLINIRGVKQGSNFVVGITLVKLLPLVFIVILGLFFIKADNLVVSHLPSLKDLGETSLILFFAFMGTETALNVSGEIKDPQRVIPRGVFLGVTGILVIYLLIQFVAQGVLGNNLAQSSDAPLAAVANWIAGPIAGTVLLVASVVSMFGMISGDVLASPRIVYAASRDGLLPNFLGRIHPRFATPWFSIIAYCCVGLIFASTGGFVRLASLASSSILVIYLAVVLATIKFKVRGSASSGGFNMPGGLTIPIIALCTIGWFLSHITLNEAISLLLFTLTTTAFYFIYQTIKKAGKKPASSSDI